MIANSYHLHTYSCLYLYSILYSHSHLSFIFTLTFIFALFFSPSSLCSTFLIYFLFHLFIYVLLLQYTFFFIVHETRSESTWSNKGSTMFLGKIHFSIQSSASSTHLFQWCFKAAICSL